MVIKEHIKIKNSEPAQMWVRRYPPVPDSSELTVVSSVENYSASRISRAVEDCDAHLLNLNVTGERDENGDMIVDIRVGCKNSDAVVRSLTRYGYDVMNTYSPDGSIEHESARERALEVLRLLDV